MNNMALMLYLDDAMKVLLQNDYIDIGYIDDDGGSQIVRNELEQKCYLREPVDIVLCKNCRFGEQTTNMRGEERYACNNRFTGIFQDFLHEPDWFCADGRRRTDE